MTQEYDYLSTYRESFEPQLERCISSRNLDLAFFWLQTYRSDLERDIHEMSPEMARACIDHYTDYELALDKLVTIKMVSDHFNNDEERIEKYLKRFVED